MWFKDARDVPEGRWNFLIPGGSIHGPEGQRKLAGGVSHRSRPPSEPALKGRWSSSRDGGIQTPLPGRIHFFAIRWLTP